MAAPNRALLLLFVSLCLAVVASCRKDRRAPPVPLTVEEPRPVPQPAPEPAPKAALVDPLDAITVIPAERLSWWYAKTARALSGRELKDLPDAAALRALAPRAFVEALTAKPDFAEEMLRFNLRFLGYDSPQPFSKDNGIDFAIFKVPAAAAAAQTLLKGGDYLTLFDGHQPLFAGAVEAPSFPRAPQAEESEGAEQPRKSDAEIRTELKPRIKAALARFAVDATRPEAEGKGICNLRFPDDEPGFEELLRGYGVDFRLMRALKNAWFGELDFYCFLEGLRRPDIVAGTARAAAAIDSVLDAVDDKAARDYMPKSIETLESYDLQAMGLPPQDAFSTDFFFDVTNSSTNYDRRRAAYVLKRFFCDDLTPINLAAPEGHAGAGRHASEPGCQSCHYKLDPMAGFFKDRGARGVDYGAEDTLIFDDMAQADRQTYADAWRAPEGSGRTWDIGYIRSLDEPTLNSYGESFPDLFRTIRAAPEAKRCLVRRIFEHFNGEGQALDPAWLEDVTRRFTEEAAHDSAAAVRRTVARVVLGHTFAEPDPVSTRCYDRPSDATTGGPPCRVSHLLEKHCASCHGAAGGLDLTRWITLVGGDAGFPHVRDGAPVPRAETMRRVVERLESTDDELRMPLNKFMPAEDREAIYLWAQKEAGT